jgi:hypothetical protein
MILINKNAIQSNLCLVYICLLIVAIMSSGVSAQDDMLTKWEIAFVESPSLISDSEALGNLRITQIGEDIFGYGSLTRSGNTLKVTVAGSSDSHLQTLYLVTPGGDTMHKLNIAINGESLSGDYEIYTTDNMKKVGTISGNRIGMVGGTLLGITPSKDLAKKDDGKEMENLANELNGEKSDLVLPVVKANSSIKEKS